MGNLLRLMTKHGEEDMNSFIIDFEDSTPSEDEKAVYDKIHELTVKTDEFCEQIKNWGSKLDVGVYSEIDDAFSEKAKFFIGLHELLEDLKKELPSLIGILMKDCDKVDLIEGNFFNCQALSKMYVKMVDSCLKFDIAKLSNSNVCNDLSTIKRSVASNPAFSGKIGITSEQLSYFSIALAYRDTMIKEIINATKGFLEKESIDPRDASKTLCYLAKICKKMVSTSEIYDQFRSPDTRIFILNVMVSLLVVADNIHPEGFLADASFEYDTNLKLLHQFPDQCNYLIRVLRFQSKTGNSPTLKSSTKHLLDKNQNC